MFMQQINNISQATEIKYKQLTDVNGVYTIFVDTSGENTEYQIIKAMIVPEEIEDGSIRQLLFFKTFFLSPFTTINEEFKSERFKEYIQSYKSITAAKQGVLDHLNEFNFNVDKNLIVNFVIEKKQDESEEGTGSNG